MKKFSERGYTIVELLVSIIGFAMVLGCVGIIYVAVHFLTKFW